MASTLTSLIPAIRNHLVEPVSKFWTDPELIEIMTRGIRDLWRDIVDLKQEHYITIDTSHVFLGPNSSTLSGIPQDVHKVYMVESIASSVGNPGPDFAPLPYNDPKFQSARAESPISTANGTIFYAIHSQGAPVNAPIIVVAPQSTTSIPIAFTYVPTLGTVLATDFIPIPGEADNACIAWTVAFARAKEHEDRSPDMAWLGIYATEKDHLLQALGLRNYQEATYVKAVFEGSS